MDCAGMFLLDGENSYSPFELSGQEIRTVPSWRSPFLVTPRVSFTIFG